MVAGLIRLIPLDEACGPSFFIPLKAVLLSAFFACRNHGMKLTYYCSSARAARSSGAGRRLPGFYRTGKRLGGVARSFREFSKPALSKHTGVVPP